MQTFQSTYQQGTRRLTALFLLLFSLHFVTIHGIAHALVLCFEANGDINIESVTGSFLTIPAEDALHAEANHNHSEPTYDTGQSPHTDISFASVCSKEQQTTRFDQQKALKYLGNVISTTIEELPRSRIFQLASFIPPLIEDMLTSNLQTVVLLN